MTSTELRSKVEKATEAVRKIENTIERHKAQAEKKRKNIEANGWDPENPWCKEGTAEHDNAYWAICEYQDKVEAIRTANEKLAEKKQTLANWENKLNKQIDSERIIANEVPEAFKQARAKLVEEWVAADIEARNYMLDKKAELSYEEFRKIYKYSTEEALTHTDYEFRKIEEREADIWLLNLYMRVKEITGKVIDCENIHWGGKGLDGYIIGEDGTALVETIGAGGYNIQRYHLRVLVHKK